MTSLKTRVCADWTGNGARIVLVEKCKGKSRFWCLWGSADKDLDELTPITCLDPDGKRQEFMGAFRLFREMIKTAQEATFIRSTR